MFHQPGLSGKTVPELEKTVGLMKKVVERVQRENETLKKSSASAAWQQEQLRLKVGHGFIPQLLVSPGLVAHHGFLLFPRTRLNISGVGAKLS